VGLGVKGSWVRIPPSRPIFKLNQWVTADPSDRPLLCTAAFVRHRVRTGLRSGRRWRCGLGVKTIECARQPDRRTAQIPSLGSVGNSSSAVVPSSCCALSCPPSLPFRAHLIELRLFGRRPRRPLLNEPGHRPKDIEVCARCSSMCPFKAASSRICKQISRNTLQPHATRSSLGTRCASLVRSRICA
jgi:hypothetical protein